MRVLVACEYSGQVRDAFLDLGQDAVSCDLRPSESKRGAHYWGDLGKFSSTFFQEFDLMVAFPPCTHLASSGARWFKDKKEQQEQAITFVRWLSDLPIKRIAIENPVGVLSTRWRKPDQIVHPWMFGDPYSKSTCLWLKNLPLLQPTNVVDKGEFVIHGGKRIPRWYSNRNRRRDETFPGMASAMAEQWGKTSEQ